MCRMTIEIFFLACTFRLFIIDVYATGNQNHCENVVHMKVRRGISFNRAHCTMVDLPEIGPATNCIQILQDLRGDALAVESRSATSWCCIFQSGLVRHFLLLCDSGCIQPDVRFCEGGRACWVVLLSSCPSLDRDSVSSIFYSFSTSVNSLPNPAGPGVNTESDNCRLEVCSLKFLKILTKISLWGSFQKSTY